MVHEELLLSLLLQNLLLSELSQSRSKGKFTCILKKLRQLVCLFLSHPQSLDSSNPFLGDRRLLATLKGKVQTLLLYYLLSDEGLESLDSQLDFSVHVGTVLYEEVQNLGGVNVSLVYLY